MGTITVLVFEHPDIDLLTQFTQAVAGDRAEVTQLLPANVGPHDYQATPTDAQTLSNADVLVKNGLEAEAFLEDLVANANNAELQTIDSAVMQFGMPWLG